jgi:hypothetical protein
MDDSTATKLSQFVQSLIKRRFLSQAYQGFHHPSRAMLRCGNINPPSRDATFLVHIYPDMAANTLL